ncbi:M67 family metallopeptidase [Candidatus Aerophobetes bacterium]|nr:M67 family metallopeptidase [Candidatus Aerophobetes bacterium]
MIILKKEQLNFIIEHCRREYPLEACGILLGKDKKVEEIFSTKNARNSSTEYLVDPEEQFRIFKKIWKREKELVGIYHSHPVSPAYPSEKDKKMAFYPEASYIIVSLQNFVSPEVKSFRLKEGRVSEEKIIIEG